MQFYLIFLPPIFLKDLQENHKTSSFESPLHQIFIKKIFAINTDNNDDFKNESVGESNISHKKSTQIDYVFDHKPNLSDKDAYNFLTKRLDTIQDKFLSNESL